MKFLFVIVIFSASFAFYACKEVQSEMVLKTYDKHWLDSVIMVSDSSYSKPYKRADFVTANYYINKKDSSVCQVMKDSFNIIRQIILSKHDVRIYYAAYFSNGQLQADLPLDAFGQFHGTATYYFINGKAQSTGKYNHGFKNGKWEIYNEEGDSISTEEYNENGQMSKKYDN